MRLAGSLRASVIGGLVGAVLVLLAWRGTARWLDREHLAPSIAIPSCLKAQPDARYAGAVAKSRRQVLSMMQRRRIPALSVSVAIDGRVVWSEAFGFASLEDSVPACPETRFRIASVSKPMTAVAMMRLREQGALDLDAPIASYAASLPAQLQAITARQLAGHRAGIRPYHDDSEAAATRHYGDVVESLDRFVGDSLRFAPGTSHEYSSYGYVLLSAVMQGAAHRSFEHILEEQVWQPLALAHTSLEHAGASLPNVAKFYDHVTPYVRDGEVRPSPPMDMSGKWASGGMLSTSDDLTRVGSALLPGARDALLRDDSRELLFRSHSRLVPLLFGYSLGWIAARDADLRRTYMHFGAGSGGTGWLGIFPDQRTVVAVLANLGHAGFTYDGSIGIASNFAPMPWEPAVFVATSAFLLFAVATFAASAGLRWMERHAAQARG